MSGYIFTRSVANKRYVYYKYSYRVKIKSKNKGKTRNTGKSKVITINKYLGPLETVLNKLGKKDKIVQKEYELERYGLEAALYEIAENLTLPKLLEESFKGEVSGIKVSEYLLVAIINRASQTEPKSHIVEYMKNNILSRIMKIDYRKLISANYWQAYEKVISEKEMLEKREEIKLLKAEPMTKEIKKEISRREKEYSDIKKIDDFQIRLWEILAEKEEINSDDLYIDSTNFYNYIKNLNGETLLCAKGKNKEGRDNLNQITIMNAITADYGIPILTEIYKGNYNDVSLFPTFLTKLIQGYTEIKNKVKSINICYDKGNNSTENYNKINELGKESKIKINVIGSLSNEHYEKLMNIRLKKYENKYKEYKYYTQKEKVFGVEQKIVITYYEKRKKREAKLFKYRVEKYKKKIEYYFSNLKDKTKKRITEEELQKRINKQIVKYQPYQKIINIKLEKNQDETILKITLNKKKLLKEYKKFGKTILFSSNIKLSEQEIIDIYYAKTKIDVLHKMLKCPEGVLFHPNWHWTDSKLKVQAFVNIMALTLVKLLEKKFNEKQKKFKLNALSIKVLLKEIKKILITKENIPHKSEIAINKLNPIQQSLFEVFNLQQYLNI